MQPPARWTSTPGDEDRDGRLSTALRLSPLRSGLWSLRRGAAGAVGLRAMASGAFSQGAGSSLPSAGSRDTDARGYAAPRPPRHRARRARARPQDHPRVGVADQPRGAGGLLASPGRPRPPFPESRDRTGPARMAAAGKRNARGEPHAACIRRSFANHPPNRPTPARTPPACRTGRAIRVPRRHSSGFAAGGPPVGAFARGGISHAKARRREAVARAAGALHGPNGHPRNQRPW